jgi:hypothetical protein
MRQLSRILLSLAALTTNVVVVESFYMQPNTRISSSRILLRAATTSTTASSTTAPIQTPEQKARRKELLKREGTHFQLDKRSGVIEFGAAANLVTTLETPDDDIPNDSFIEEWLLDGRGLAMSIWEEGLMTELPDSVYRLKTMPLQFVTLNIQPSVDMLMWTQQSGRNNAGRVLPPIFKLQSQNFDVRVNTGLSKLTAEELGIYVEVVGDLRPTSDKTGVTGKICFQTRGELPPPLRLVPDQILKLAADTINETITKFAVASFQKGAIEQYNQYKTNRLMQ